MNAENYIKNIEAYLVSECETAQVDFKVGFDPKSNQDWCELIKDIVAMANNGGGCIIIGKNDDGSASDSDLKAVLELDPAEVSNKVEKYTSFQYADFRIIARKAEGKQFVCLVLGGVNVPMTFTKPGTYAAPGPSQQKTAFSQGTVYFRHGTKSEPGTSDDLRAFIEREVARVRSEWLENVRKVVEAPIGAKIVVVSSDVDSTVVATQSYRLTANLEAPLVRELDPNKTHPHRQKEVARLVGEKLGMATSITPHDVFAVRCAFGVDERMEFFYKPKHASPHYSDLFIDWLVDEYRKNSNFFADAKRQLQKNSGVSGNVANGDARLQWLETYMNRHGFSMTVIGEKLGVSGSTVSLILRGVYNGNVNKLLQKVERLMETDRTTTP